MILASAQTKPVRFNIDSNLLEHYQMIELAAENGADLIAFPEMSISGYERDKARELSFTPDDPRLEGLKKLSAEYDMVIIAGAPVAIGSELFIGSFIIQPEAVFLYTKHYLHTGEENYFSSTFDYNPLIELKQEKISLAICADIDHPEHPEMASKVNTSIYIPSIFFSPGGLPGAYQNLSSYAQKYSFNILMSNFCQEAYGKPAGGKSAFWNNHGELIGNLNSEDKGLLLVEKTDGTWASKTIYV